MAGMATKALTGLKTASKPPMLYGGGTTTAAPSGSLPAGSGLSTSAQPLGPTPVQTTVSPEGVVGSSAVNPMVNKFQSDILDNRNAETMQGLMLGDARAELAAKTRANDVAHMLGGNSDNYQNVTGTTHTISTDGAGGTGTRKSSSSGVGEGGLTLDQIKELMGAFKQDFPTIPPPTTPATVPGPVATPVDQSRAFAQAKDSSSRVARSALRSLKDSMTARGLSGSGIEAQNEADIMSNLAGVQSGALFDAAAQDETRQWDAAKTGYQGAITQRNQDIGVGGTGYQGGITQRGQNMDYGQQLLTRLQGFLPFLRY